MVTNRDELLLEKGRVLFAGECEFLRGAAGVEDIPKSKLPEVAFAGRSNVGKSSLINALTGRRYLARVSNTPGRTREINFFSLSRRLMVADLPGYGFARVSRAQSMQWTELIFAYLRGRAQLRRVIFLVDARRGFMDSDNDVMELLDRAAVSYQIVLTKADKVKSASAAEVLTATETEAKRHGAAHPLVLLTSALEGTGLGQLRAEIAAFAR